MSVRLGEILVKESLITQDQLQKALEFQRANGGKLGSCLTKMGFITDDDITGVLSRQYGVPSMNLISSIAKTLVGSVMAMVRTEPTRDSGITW